MFFCCSLSAQEIRVGLIGLDTSHVTAFTEQLNNHTVPGAKVVAAVAGGSPDIPESVNRMPQYIATLRDKWGVDIVAGIPELLTRVDAIMLTSVDGRPHLEQVRPVIAAHKPVFIDKPMAGSLKDVREIFRLCAEAKTPCFSASSLRYYPTITALKAAAPALLLAVDAYSPATLEAHHSDLYWYGIHGVEILYTLMGPGCRSVQRTFTDDQEMVVGVWKDGRIGTFHGFRKGDHTYGATLYPTKGAAKHSEPVVGATYKQLLEQVVKFFQTGAAPVTPEETIEMFAFMDAAQLSRQRGGARVELSEIQ